MFNGISINDTSGPLIASILPQMGCLYKYILCGIQLVRIPFLCDSQNAGKVIACRVVIVDINGLDQKGDIYPDVL